MSRREAWTAREIELLRELWLKRDLYQISGAIGRSVCAIENFARSIGLPKRPRVNALSDEVVEYIRTHAKTKLGREIAEELGYSTPAVFNIAKRHGISFKKPKPTDDELLRQMVEVLLDAGFSLKAIHRMKFSSYSTLHRNMK